jgi:hypothetical protein
MTKVEYYSCAATTRNDQDDIDTVELTQQLLAEFEGSKATILRIQRLGELELSTCLGYSRSYEIIIQINLMAYAQKTNKM